MNKSNTEITRYVSRKLHKLGKYLVDFSPNPVDDTQGEFFPCGVQFSYFE